MVSWLQLDYSGRPVLNEHYFAIVLVGSAIQNIVGYNVKSPAATIAKETACNIQKWSNENGESMP